MLGRRQWMAAAGTVMALVVATIVFATTRDDRPPSSRAAAEAGLEPHGTIAPEPSTTATVPTTVAPSTTAVTTTTTAPAAPVRTTATVASTPAPATPDPAPITTISRVTPAPATWSTQMNGISIRARVAPGFVVGGRLFVEFNIDTSGAVPGCCRTSVRFSDGLSAGVLPQIDCPSTSTEPTSGAASRRFTAAGSYTVTFIARTCPPPPPFVVGESPVVTSVTAQLDVCLRIVLDSPTSSSSPGPCA